MLHRPRQHPEKLKTKIPAGISGRLTFLKLFYFFELCQLFKLFNFYKKFKKHTHTHTKKKVQEKRSARSAAHVGASVCGREEIRNAQKNEKKESNNSNK